MNDRNSSDQIKALFVRSAAALQTGDAETARKGLQKVVRHFPQSAAAWYNLGLSHQHLDRHLDAVKAYRKAVSISPEVIDGWINLGLSYKELGQQKEAEQSVDKALALDSRHSRALNLRATLAAENGQHDQARSMLEKSLEYDPVNNDARLNLANLHLEMDNAGQAQEVVAPLLAADPDNKEYLQLHARILLQQKEFEKAAAIVLKLQDDYPGDEMAMRLALSYREVIRDHFGVISIAEELLQRFPGDAGIWNSLGGGYFQLDSIHKSKECYEKAITLDPDHPEYENNVGLTYSSLGDKQNAELHYRKSIALNPAHAEAYRNIVAMKRFKSVDDPDAIKLKELFDQPDLDDFSVIKSSFALGKIYDDCGLYEQAFATYQRGNDLKFRDSRTDLTKYFDHIDRVPQVFDRRPVHVASQGLSPQPIFVLGMPRSGTTLVEQIITRHPDVFGCGELPCIERAITRLEKKARPMRVYPDTFWEIQAEAFESEAREYLGWVERLHEIDEPYFTDKMPFNFVHVWLIKALFADAAIVHCRRHPMDVITSNYFQLYGSDISFVYQLEALANYTVRYYRLMDHWQTMFGDEIVNVQYEALVGDAENQTRRLIGAIGLPWNDACLDQKTSDTAVRTASIWQVRQGIYTSSRERWRNYQSHLQPSLEILVAEGILDPDGSMKP